MSRAVPIVAALAAAMSLAIGVAVVVLLKPAQATFPGVPGKIAYVGGTRSIRSGQTEAVTVKLPPTPLSAPALLPIRRMARGSPMLATTAPQGMSSTMRSSR